MTYLLDVNVLIALLDADHLHHVECLSWVDSLGSHGWATSPTVPNGVVRMMGAAGYTSVSFGWSEVVRVLSIWCSAPEHRFWADDMSFFDPRFIDPVKLTSPGRITDTYLLALAAARGGMLATLGRRLSPDAVTGGRAALPIVE